MTKVEVVNLALSDLGSSLITTLGDNSVPGSHYGDLNFDVTLKEMLRLHPWSFATKEVDLAQKPSPGVSNWKYSYYLPSYFVRVLRVIGSTQELNEENFSRTSDGIHSNEDSVRLEYIHSDITPSQYDPDFLQAFIVLLASKLAVPVKQDVQLRQLLREEFERILLPRAKAADTRETGARENRGPWRAIDRSPTIQSRYNSSF